ncbi:MAG: hypothetical protein JSW54_12295 [Fidelibacterota bacterium]|nr:MAG: hypothetical protein JSW54_12295 [Candidatus Neomarinimicrobiota bacterium]
MSIILTGALGLILVSFTVPDALRAQADAEVPHQHMWEQYCFDCHQCKSPTKEEPCLKGCPYTGVTEAPLRSAAEQYPDIILINQLAELYAPVRFTHKAHADMSNMGQGCAECHHNSQSGKIPGCGECHQPGTDVVNLKQPGLKGAYHRQCLTCHKDWSHKNACDFCHAPVEVEGAGTEMLTAIRPAVPTPQVEANVRFVYPTDYAAAPVVTFPHQEHDRAFGLACVDCHTGVGCVECHDVNRTALASIDRTRSCFSCHGEENCGICHDSRERRSTYHAVPANWALGSRHDKLNCEECHGPTRNSTTPSSACGSCHTNWGIGNFDHSDAGLRLTSGHEELDCESCHRDELYARQPECSDCHDDLTYPEYLPGERLSN